ncbi:MAG TPA: hypothetical protein VNO50_18015 [Pyrinomonadaceae bacterium]|nr:hypothetical protein [Pyrinomonadaceae bacterium]
MMKTMFCPKCGADGQTAEAYCRSCGEWLPDIDALARPRLFRKLSRDEKIAKRRVLEMVSAGLSVTSAAVILSVLAGGNDLQILFLALICCVLVAVYQIVNFYLGHKIQRTIERSRAEVVHEIEEVADKRVETLGSADAISFVGRGSVVENTTELLEPIPRGAKRVD